MGLFDTKAVDQGIASLFDKKLPQSALQREPLAPRPAVEPQPEEPEEESSSEASEPEHVEELEDAYMKKVAKQQLEAEPAVKPKSEAKAEETKVEKPAGSSAHSDLERTLFVKNVPYAAMTDRKIQKAFKAAFGPGIQSIRFRSIPLGEVVPRKVGFIKQKLNEKRDAVNSYIVYETKERCYDAYAKMNLFEFEDHHLFVDSAAKPRVHVAKRSVFIGNLNFDATEEQLYRKFADVGKIENLRIVRDRKFNIGKGFAYIQFEDVSNVQLALLKNDTEFDGRKLRVVRCSKTAKSTQTDGAKGTKHEKSFKQKQTKRSHDGKPKNADRAMPTPTDAKSGLVLEGERSKPGSKSSLNRKRKPRSETGRNKRARKSK